MCAVFLETYIALLIEPNRRTNQIENGSAPSPRIKFRLGVEEREAAQCTDIDAIGLIVVPVAIDGGPSKRRLRP